MYISVISKRLAWCVHNDKVTVPEPDKTDVIKELLHVTFKHSILPHFDVDDIDIIIQQLSMEYCFSFFLYLHCVPKKGSHQTLASNFVKS